MNDNGHRESRTLAQIMATLADAEVNLSELPLQEAHTKATNAEIAWIAHFDLTMEDLEEEYAKRKEKLPGEEKCVGIARRRDGWERWRDWRRAERRVKGLESQMAQLGRVISACQSELKQAQAEVGFVQPGRAM